MVDSATDLDSRDAPLVSPAPPRGPRTVGPWLVGGAVSAVLLLLAGRYGYHRDELYFLLCGRHLDWGYVDQGPLVPALARLMDTVAPGNLVLLRTPSALIAGAAVVVVAAIAREFGGGRAGQLFAAFLAAVAGIVLAPGHLLSTTTVDLLVWLVAAWCAVRMLRTGDTRWALGVGLALGVGMLNKLLPALLAVGLLAGVAVGGPRRLLRDRWVYAAAGIVVVLAAPYLLWQATHGFPQLSVASSIAGGDSSYSGRLDALQLQLVIISPVAVPVWIAGLVALLHRPAWRAYRAIGWAWLVVFAVVLLAGGKGYYDAPLLLVVTAAGAVVTAEWAGRGAVPARRTLLASGAAVAVTGSAVLLLPTLPADRLPGFVVDVNYDAGETIGWPAFADSLAAVHRGLPPEQRTRVVILTANYGEAGAVARYGPQRGLPRAYSGHNSMAGFGRPPEDADVVIAVGWARPDQLRRWFTEVTETGRIDQRVDVDNDENGLPVYVCRGLRRPWSQIWDTEVRHAG
ncbi:glycosyltransferase family 39 protein [Micromonospora sp. DR5-3]|uniref:glycosyltransferase family 39 protein n=1 Tax=unclassified Micromonospora TaxID=2617518 RepID=UPI0011D6E04D|nr:MULTISPECIES: glycosyltransferase family 39 protein [unclassified Micromonospora]MCW3818220.1 glycosyltransferase family 39 protein [Micromonospora sp. DR5-3]TYC21668.1 glycosyltransferase family 39 protein [Micromonospora sp. MP36]